MKYFLATEGSQLIPLPDFIVVQRPPRIARHTFIGGPPIIQEGRTPNPLGAFTLPKGVTIADGKCACIISEDGLERYIDPRFYRGADRIIVFGEIDEEVVDHSQNPEAMKIIIAARKSD